MIVPRSNVISSLSLNTLKRIFTGQITNWSAVGAQRLPIHLYARDDKSGGYETFASLVLGDVPMANAKQYKDSEKLDSDVSNDPGGIGFISMPYVKSTRAVWISDGTAPGLKSPAKVGNYALSRRLYLYTPAQPQNTAAADFVRFVVSAQGQDIVRKAQFTPDMGEASDLSRKTAIIALLPGNVKPSAPEESVKRNLPAPPKLPSSRRRLATQWCGTLRRR